MWRDVDFDDGSVTFRHTKTRRNRTVPLTDETVTALRKLQAQTRQIGGPFRDMVDNVYRQWRRIRKKAKCSDVTIHNLRDTCATRPFERGTAPKVVMKLLGHTNLSTTLRHHVEVSDDDLRDAVCRLSAGYNERGCER
ncbi:MAG: site-specific integrase [Phycisphaerales bacterium]|nr:MAG: site-specific integrase [Phycisphaerales bacterium]